MSGVPLVADTHPSAGVKPAGKINKAVRGGGGCLRSFYEKHD
jgi:hypothetical protein